MLDAQNPSQNGAQISPFIELDRADWAALAPSMPAPLRETEIVQLRGLGEPLDLREVAEVYLPLSRLLNLYVGATKSLHDATSEFLGERVEGTPFVIGVAGSVAVGKSTIARLLRELLARWDRTPRVELVTTDGFLFPNAELERRGHRRRQGGPARPIELDERRDLRAVRQRALRIQHRDSLVSAGEATAVHARGRRTAARH